MFEHQLLYAAAQRGNVRFLERRTHVTGWPPIGTLAMLDSYFERTFQAILEPGDSPMSVLKV